MMVKLMMKLMMKFMMPVVIMMSASSVFASDSTIHLDDVTIRATTPNAKATAIYAIIHNQAHSQDRLIGAEVSFAKKVEIHEMKMEGDVMKMREIQGGLVIPAHGMAELAQGGNHLMVMGLAKAVMMDGDYEVTFLFEKAGALKARAHVISLSGKSAHGKSAQNKSDHGKSAHKEHTHKGHAH